MCEDTGPSRVARPRPPCAGFQRISELSREALQPLRRSHASRTRLGQPTRPPRRPLSAALPPATGGDSGTEQRAWAAGNLLQPDVRAGDRRSRKVTSHPLPREDLRACDAGLGAVQRQQAPHGACGGDGPGVAAQKEGQVRSANAFFCVSPEAHALNARSQLSRPRGALLRVSASCCLWTCASFLMAV